MVALYPLGYARGILLICCSFSLYERKTNNKIKIKYHSAEA